MEDDGLGSRERSVALGNVGHRSAKERQIDELKVVVPRLVAGDFRREVRSTSMGIQC